MPDGSVLGDPEQLGFTTRLIAMGWRPPSPLTAFDLRRCSSRSRFCAATLRDPAGGRSRGAFATSLAGLVRPSRPEVACAAAVSDMIFEAEECATQRRPSADSTWGRRSVRAISVIPTLHLLPVVAAHMGLDISCHASLWKDRALVELNQAVLHSFREDGLPLWITIPPRSSS